MNKCILIGNLTRDPELTMTAANVSLCRFSIAVNRNYTNASGEREADFINIVAWRGLADNCGKFLTKGKKVAVCGSMQTRTYDDKDGNKRYATEVVAEDVEFISARTPGEGGETGAKTQQLSKLEPIDSDDLPF